MYEPSKKEIVVQVKVVKNELEKLNELCQYSSYHEFAHIPICMIEYVLDLLITEVKAKD